MKNYALDSVMSKNSFVEVEVFNYGHDGKVGFHFPLGWIKTKIEFNKKDLCKLLAVIRPRMSEFLDELRARELLGFCLLPNGCLRINLSLNFLSILDEATNQPLKDVVEDAA